MTDERKATRSLGTRRVATRALAVLMAAVVLGLPALALDASAKEGSMFRPAQASPGGAVASTSRLASEAGLAVLADGGNAIDAAVATTFAVGVTRPEMCGIGGGGWLVYRGADGTIAALDFREAAPAAMPPWVGRDNESRPGSLFQPPFEAGHKTVLVPGMVKGMAAALEAYGTIDLAEAVAAAEKLARDGFPVSRELAAWSASSYGAPRLALFPEAASIYLTNDVAPLQEGATLVQEDYARSLRLIAEAGVHAFYEGEIAHLIVQDMEGAASVPVTGLLMADVGLLTLQDMAAYEAKWRAPLVGTYQGHEIIAMPPPTSGGVAVLEALNILELFDLRGSAEQSSFRHLHYLAEAQKIALADRGKYLGDPDFVSVPVRTLISKEYAQLRKADIKETAGSYKAGNISAGESTPGDDAPGSHTTAVTVVDQFGNAVAVMCSINVPFGSAVVAPGTGFLLNNHVFDFNLQNPGTPNGVEPGKRPMSNGSPTVVVRDGQPRLVVSGAGGIRIISGALQAIVNVVDFDLDIAHAVDAERLQAFNRVNDIDMFLEDARITPSVLAQLEAAGHVFQPQGEYAGGRKASATAQASSSFVTSNTQVAGTNATTGHREAASDPRGEHGAAAANQAPAAAGSADKVVVDRVRPVHFTDHSTDPDGRVVRWLWDFGDGKTSTDQHPSHLYKQLGTLDVALTVWDDYANQFSACCKSGASSTAHVANIEVKNIPPAGGFHGQGGGNGAASEEIEANRVEPVPFADASTDADGEVVAWRWDFGDGASSEAQNPSHQYTQLGTFIVRLTATDNDGGTGGSERTVSVVNLLPTAAFKVDPAHPMVLALTDFLDASTDPDGEPAAWGWAFGDGETAKGQQVSHRYLEGGWYEVRLSIADNDGGAAMTTTRVYVCSPGGDAVTLLDPRHVRLEFEACVHASPEEMPRLLPMGLADATGGLPGLLWVLAAGTMVLRRRARGG